MLRAHRATLVELSALLGEARHLITQALFFSPAHAWQGPRGMFLTGIAAVTYGAFYLLSGRNLWLLILAHGAWDSLGVWL